MLPEQGSILDRRSFLGCLASLPLLSQVLAQDSLDPASKGRKRSLILIWMDGGMSHIDTFDGKPEASPDIRGELKSKEAALEGVFMSEHLPELAKRMKKCALLRSLTSGEGNHDRASHYMLTGHRPSPVLRYPSLGSVLGLDDKPSALPDYVAIPQAPTHGRQGFLPSTRLPFDVGSDPAKPGFAVPNLRAPTERKRALELLKKLDAIDGQARSNPELARDRFMRQARLMGEDPVASKAFDLRLEKAAVAKRYGRHSLGRSLLLARRLVAFGVRVVLVRSTGWDHHSQIKQRLTYGFPPRLTAMDQSLPALIDDLERMGLDERVTVLLSTEFGRTPRINGAGGRDHWARASSALLFGAGIRRGVVHGKTDARGEEPAEHAVSPADLHATLLAALQVPADKAMRTADGRPIPLVEREAKPITELLT